MKPKELNFKPNACKFREYCLSTCKAYPNGHPEKNKIKDYLMTCKPAFCKTIVKTKAKEKTK